MSKVGVSLKIDVSKIDKARLFKGNKGTYLDATVFIDLNEFDQYGNSGMITQDVTKDEKQQGVKGAILGNCKVFWSDTQQAPAQQYQQAPQQYQQPVQQQRPPQQAPAGAPMMSQQQYNQQAAVDDWEDDIPFSQAGR